MIEIARHTLTGDWVSAQLTLGKGGWIRAAYASGLVTHGWQCAGARPFVLHALPVLDDQGDWIVYADDDQSCDIHFCAHCPDPIPFFTPIETCTKGCFAYSASPPIQVIFRRNPRRAVAIPYTGEIIIDPAFFESIRTVAGRLAIYAHEMGHLLGANCQDCADYYSGKFMAAIGICPRDAIQTFDRAIYSREASPAFVAGYYAR